LSIWSAARQAQTCRDFVFSIDFTEPSPVRAGLADTRTRWDGCQESKNPSQSSEVNDAGVLEEAKREVARWLVQVGALVAQEDEELVKSVELIKKLEAMFTPAPGEEDRPDCLPESRRRRAA
jgi:uncharacterized protein YhdP